MDLVLVAPPTVDEKGFELFLGQFGRRAWSESHQICIDLGDVTFIDPYGMVGILEFGYYLKSLGKEVILRVPGPEEVSKYLERMDFFRFRSGLFVMDPPHLDLTEKYHRSIASDVLLEITRIEKSDDIHFIVDRVRDRAGSILETHLHYDERAIHHFIVALSEVCQNILEHSQNIGYVGIQKYFYAKSLAKNVVKIAVMDLGIGIKNSLSPRFSLVCGERWSDLLAIEKALLHGASRYEDIGRGHGLTEVRKFVQKWNGKISIRSGTAKFSVLPSWESGLERRSGVTFFPGTQISLVLPEINR
ncbi:MAG: sensor histidine kinase [Syntrophobacterales bacterium]|nr:MAG: sensor histidine kinase [Syntrophobacterales bacterium]